MRTDQTNRSRGLRRVLSRTRNAIFYAVPIRWRGKFAAALPSSLAPPLTKSDYFEQFYDDGHDPYGFDVNPNEQLKFRRTLEVCGEGDLGRVFEIGCAVGSLTEMIAPQALDILAIDVSSAAIEQARERLSGQSHVHFETRTLPGDFPDREFDLVVASDVLYYLPLDDLLTCLRQIEGSLAPGGRLVALHYVPRVGTMLSGNEVHDILNKYTMLEHTLEQRPEFGPGRPYRVDRYEKVG